MEQGTPRRKGGAVTLEINCPVGLMWLIFMVCDTGGGISASLLYPHLTGGIGSVPLRFSSVFLCPLGLIVEDVALTADKCLGFSLFLKTEERLILHVALRE